MEITQQLVKEKFRLFNSQIFGGKLPLPRICLSHAKTFLGACTFKTKRGLTGKKTRYDFAIRISTLHNMDEREMEDTLIHEMIHYYIGVNQMEDTSPHGKLFRSMMNDINSRFGRNINISHRGMPVSEEQQSAPQRRSWHVIAIVRLSDGRTGVKVLPRVAPSILKFYNGVLSSKEVTGVELYLSDAPYFYKFPNSSSLRLHVVDRQEATGHLAGARRIECNGKSVKVCQ